MEYFDTFKINSYIYQFKDRLGSLITLVIGTKKALVFDTGYGIASIYSKVREYTSLELIVINSHGHMDHTCGNFQFSKVYIDSFDKELCIKHNSKKWRINNINMLKKTNFAISEIDEEKYINQTCNNLKEIDFEMFDLGNINVRVIKMPGHTKGSIGLLLENEKILLVGDATCRFVWLFLEESTTCIEYIKMLSEVLQLDFNYFLVGHTPGLLEKKEMFEYLNIAKSIDFEKCKRVSFNNFESLNSYAYPFSDLYKEGKYGIIFDPNKY